MNDDAHLPATRRIRRLHIDELFGPDSAVIHVDFRRDARVTVLHGRNGSGKTITLELLDALSAGRFEILYRYPFKKLTLELEDNTSLTIHRHLSQGNKGIKKRHQRPDGVLLRYHVEIDGAEEDGELVVVTPDLAPLVDFIRQHLPWIVPVGPGEWDDKRSLLRLDDKELLAQYGEFLDPLARRALSRRQEQTSQHPKLWQFVEVLPRVKFIRADRLFTRDEPRAPDFDPTRGRHRISKRGLMVERLSQNIRALVSKADREYTLTSSRLDSTLSKRLFAEHPSIPSLDDLKERSRNLREKAKHQTELGLLRDEPGAVDEASLTEEQKRTAFIILQDQEEKLDTFNEVVTKVQRLLESLNRKLAPKTVRLNVETGYAITTGSGAPLDLAWLSSGEQHELVLLHELLFDVNPDSLILIDEPELSLHPTWQAEMLPELLEIAQLSRLDVVLATHSPYVVGEHAELMVRLGEPV